ncbi:hypothetical protein BD311DRAFT_804404 [Dichomitus squalens]|uniref:Uncharacterized protein n=1 Tax=Dichomitus squalens TaxID=114155 RepID=A0A4V2K1A0_9APHY|nr:hypothetical protein BD311DRAFT_804404 [Dichomitus squalens]
MSRITGKEHQDICRDLLGLIIGLPLPGGASPVRLVRATRALLDFLYLAQYPTQTEETLGLLDKALASFHENKAVLVDLNIRSHFRLPKLHSLDHYRHSIELFGTTDNYDTQYSERLHIDMTKDAYRATNRKDELAQMTVWLERKEKMQRHEKHIQWRLCQLHLQSPPPPHDLNPPPPIAMVPAWPHLPTDDAPSPRMRIEMTRHPTIYAVDFPTLALAYGATHFRDALTRYVAKKNNPIFTAAQVKRESAKVYMPMQKVSVYHKVKFWVSDPQRLTTPGNETHDVIHVRPARKNKYGDGVPARFDTALVREDQPTDAETPQRQGVHQFRVAQSQSDLVT